MQICVYGASSNSIDKAYLQAGEALGEAMDIRQGTPFLGACKIYAGSYEDAADSDIVIITSGIARKPGQTRLELCQINVNILKSITPQIVKYAPKALYVFVSNPVDVLTYAFCKISGLPEKQIIGSGTLLDTARLRTRIAEYMNVNQGDVHAYVLGEHGDSSFVPWSTAHVSSVPLDEFQKRMTENEQLTAELDYESIEEYMRTSGGKIIARKGATFYALAMSVCHICECINANANAVLTLSTMLHGEYGIDDVCLSLPTIVNAQGVNGKVLPAMTDEEIEKLRNSARTLRSVIDQVNI